MTSRAANLLASMVIASIAIPRSARADCCFSTTATTTARLATWERGAAVLSTAYVRELGFYSSTARAVPLGTGVSDQQLRFDLTGLVRVTDELTLSLLVPLAMNARASGEQSALGGGLGDIGVGVRYDLLQFDHSKRPGLALVGGVAVPTGRAAEAAERALAVDATGKGTAVFSLGVSSELAWEPWFVRADLMAGIPIPTQASGEWRWLSPTLDLTLMGGVRATKHLFFSVSARFGAQLPTAVQAAGYDMALGAGIAVKPDTQWALIANVTTSLFAPGAGMNRNAPLAASLAVRYAAF